MGLHCINIPSVCSDIYFGSTATKADNLKDDLSMILGELKEKVGQVDNKLSLIDHDTLAGNMLKRPLEEFEKVGQFTDNKLLKNMMYHKTGWTLLQLYKNKNI